MHQEDERIKFLHTSLFLEGNLLTLRETVKLIQEGDLIAGGKYKDIAHTKGYAQAMQYMLTLKSLSLDEIQNIHRICMKDESFAGQLRKENVHIKDNPHFKTANHIDIGKKLTKLLATINTYNKKNIIELCDAAAHLHNEFQHIHPFLDGN